MSFPFIAPLVFFLQVTLEDGIWISLSLVFFIWLYSWAKANLGSARLAVLFAAIVIYLTVFQHPELVWIGVLLFLLATFGKEAFDKVHIFKK